MIHYPKGKKIGEASKGEKAEVEEGFEKARRIREEGGKDPIPENNREGAKDPNANSRAAITAAKRTAEMAEVAVGVWEGAKWIGAFLAAPETGGASLVLAGAAP